MGEFLQWKMFQVCFRWSYGGPSPLILKRMIGLARDTAAVLDNHIEGDMALKLTVFFLRTKNFQIDFFD